MRRTVTVAFASLVALLLIASAGLVTAGPVASKAETVSSDTATGTDPATPNASVVAVYPNPVADEDAGEFVIIAVPPGTDLGSLAIGDGETHVALPNVTAGGRVTLSTHANLTRSLLDRRVYPLPDQLQLANSGERLRLYRSEKVLDSIAYDSAPEGKVRVRDGDRPWRALGTTDRPVVTAEGGRVTAFVLPDAPDIAVDHLRSADERILLAAYTLTSGRVADALVAAARRGVDVRVLVEGGPVGGMTTRQAHLLDRLTRTGVEVRALGGDRVRYRYHHAKYAVVDDRALVTTENWKPAGVGGNGSRGWGVVTAQSQVVEGLAETFRADASWQDARPWAEVRERRAFTDAEVASDSYPSRFEAARVPVEGARLLVAPDNAEAEIRTVIGSAEESLAIQQVTLGSLSQPFVRETLSAARRGVRVRVLLSGAWYVREDNERLVAWLNDRADSEGLPLTARVADPGDRFEKIHAKGAIVDGERTILGSLNWNNNSARKNREVVLVLEGSEVGAYYLEVFDADWSGTSPDVPLGMIAVLVVVVLAAFLVARTIDFES